MEIQKNINSIASLNSLEKGLDYFTAGTSAFVTGVIADKVIKETIIRPLTWLGMNQCLEFPKTVYDYSSSIRTIRFSMHEYLPIFKDGLSFLVLKVPAIEGLMFHVVLQNLLLTKAPKAILNRYAPSYSSIVDTKAAKIARVALTAMAVSFSVMYPPGFHYCGTARLDRFVGLFARALVLSTVQEVTKSPLVAILARSGSNLLT